MSRRKPRKRPRKARFGDFPLGFGRFVGRPIATVPPDYLDWALKARGVPAADKWAIGQWLRSREGGAR